MGYSKYIYFGENVEGYDIPVLNEREARAGAGLLLLPAIYSFANSYLTHDFFFTKIFVTLFMVDFFIRVMINPKYAPTLILARIIIGNQTPEYVGAPQKHFAWAIGLVLAIVMFFLVVILEIMTPIKIIICLLCIALLYSESVFGICLGCIIYKKVRGFSAQYCPGNVCSNSPFIKEDVQKISRIQWMVLGTFIVFLSFTTLMFNEHMEEGNNLSMKCEAGKCGIN